MSKRVFEIAKEFQTDSKIILDILKRHNSKVSNHFSSISDEEYEMIRTEMQSKAAAKQKAEKKAAAVQQNYAVADGRRPEERQRIEKKQQARAAVQKQSVSREKEPAVPVKEKPAPTPVSVPASEPPKAQPVSAPKAVQPPAEPAAKPAAKPVEAIAKAVTQAPEPPVKEKPVASSRGGRGNREDSGDRGENRESRGARDRKGREGGNAGQEESRDGGKDRRDRKSRNESRERRKDNRDGAERASGKNGNAHKDRGNRRSKNRAPQPPQKVEIARPKHIKIGESIAVKDLASKMSCTAAEVIKKLLMMGVMASINQEVDFDTAALVAAEFGVTAEELPPEVDPTEIPEIEDDPKSLKLRPPVVTVMGHVDHGKTSLLDVIRKTSVSAHEAGGITQHIGAYQVNCTPKGATKEKKIVFLDTPGHEAFTAMRARGAQVTDIAILVVAADDGVMPQTIEAIHHAKSANVPIIVAINKIDKPGANPDRVMQELMEHGLVPEEYGGDNIMVPVSAKKQIGINDLLENILLVAEVQELKANPNREARGVIIEAELDKGRGPVATVLVQSGTLRIGDSIVAGTTYGKVRAMVNDRGDNVKKAGPSVPVEVLGFNDVPAAGDILASLDEKQAKSIAEHRIERQRTQLIHSKKVSLDDLFQQIQEGSIKDLNIVIKADVQGSVEALNSSLLALNKNDEVRVSIVHSGVGAVNESDVMLASASNALIIAFNVRPDANARRVADAEDIDIRTYRVIYDALNDVKAAMSGMLAPKYKEVVQGHVEIRMVMKFSKALVAGSYVLDGKIYNNSKIRIIRDNIEVFDGAIDSLRRFKDEVKEVAAGYECGISIVDYRDFREGDIIEAYTMEEVETSIAEANKAAAERRAEEAAAHEQPQSSEE